MNSITRFPSASMFYRVTKEARGTTEHFALAVNGRVVGQVEDNLRVIPQYRSNHWASPAIACYKWRDSGD